MWNPFRAASKKVVDMTLASEVKRLRELVVAQEIAINEMLARETMCLGAIEELFETYQLADHKGDTIVSRQGFMDFAAARAKVQS